MTTVTTQAELDTALKAGDPDIVIDSPRGVWLTMRDGGNVARVVGESTIRDVWGSATIRGVRGSATIRDVRGSATIHLHSSATATNVGRFVAVHLHSARAKVDGGVVIDLTKLDLTTTADWADYHGVKTVDGHLIVYKAVDADLNSGRGFHYPIGATVAAPDWNAGDFCGAGLHFSPTPAQARDYFPDAARFLECAVNVADASVIGGTDTYSTPKLKARSVRVLREVDVHGDPL
jgi:hypothetical protein